MSYSVALIIGYIEASFLSLRPVEVILWASVYFFSIYILFACIVWCLATIINRPIESKKPRNKQILLEVLDSIRTILIFSIGMLIPWAMIKLNIASFASTVSTMSIFVEVLMLIIWHDIHFYVVHRFLHSALKKSHITHHLSVTATPFTAYSMSITEAMLYSSVLPIAMLFHNFSLPSLMFLSVWSIAINTLIHANCNLFPNAGQHSFFDIIRHHQRHHSNPNGNYSFFFTRLDQWFNTTQTKAHR